MSTNRRLPFLTFISIAVIIAIVIVVILWFKPSDNNDKASEALSSIQNSDNKNENKK